VSRTVDPLKFDNYLAVRQLARRIMAALDACDGIRVEDLETAGRLSAAEESTLRRLKKERDTLLKLCREGSVGLAHVLGSTNDDTAVRDWQQRCRETIALVERPD
jgi:hypothetical protein